MSISDNIQNVRKRVGLAASKSGRGAEEIKIIAVIKNVPLEQVFAALAEGMTDIGENRIQEAEERYKKIKEKYPKTNFHFIGHLQRNKVRQSLDMFDIIHSVDSLRLMQEIDARAMKPVSVLIEVNTSGETSKFGIEFDKAIELAELATSFKNINVQGLMTMGPLTDDPAISRDCFRRLKVLKDRIVSAGIALPYLSMGMSGDFEVAVEEGSNMVRVGRAIFKGG
ncbi:MAG: YggS family pyridoxal phosphate-dependent enzyme [Candidatus Margulisiibacteriota bacterium]